MYRTEVYLRDDQRSKLQDVSFVLSKKENKRVGMAEVIRKAIDEWLKKNVKKLDETDLILNSSILVQEIGNAQKDLKKGKLLSRDEIF